ncbi:MAG: hypothetical protein HN404_27030, partial [Gemmatimonadetes bacterium]|nr:hypothetical protein [Gemmatimonadota bacterium]
MASTTFRSFPFALLLLLTALTASAHNGKVALALPMEGIIVDGELGDWPATVHWHRIEHWFAGGPGRGDLDFLARVAFAHDPARRELLVAIDIRDDRLDTTGLSAEAAVWVHQSAEGAALALRPHVDDKLLEPLNPSLPFDGTAVRGMATSRDYTVAAQRGEHGYHYEWRIDVGAEIDATPSGVATVVGVAVQAVDREGAEATRLSWGLVRDDGDVILASPRQVGRLRLRVESVATGEGIGGVDVSLRSGRSGAALTARTA